MKELPDLKCAEVAAAAVKIQKVYRGFQTRKEINANTPHMKAQDVAMTAVNVQTAFKGHQHTGRSDVKSSQVMSQKVTKPVKPSRPAMPSMPVTSYHIVQIGHFFI